MNTKTSSVNPAVRKAGLVLSLCLVLAAAMVMSSGTARAEKAIEYQVFLHKSAIITVATPIKRVSVTDPKIADVVAISPTEVQVNGIAIGSTTLIVWDKTGRRTFFDITVAVDTTGLEKEIDELAPGDDVKFKMINPTTLVVSGAVKTDERKIKIENILLGFGTDITEKELFILQGGVTKEARPVPGAAKGFQFVNLLEVTSPKEVLLQITVASVDRDAARNLGINWAYVGKLTQVFGSVAEGLPFASITNFVQGATAGSNSLLFQNSPNFGIMDSPSGTMWMLKALASKGLAKILAEPNLIVKSGERGNFLAGGEFPIPVVQTSTQGTFAPVTIQFKKFGVQLDFVPTVQENGLIQLKLDPAEVSSLDFANAVTLSGFRIPALKTDTVHTSVDLRDGETFVIAGLIRDDWSKNMEKIPLLGDIPILGAFFREQQLSKTEQELVFLVTPKLMTPLAPGAKVELPGANEPTPEQENDLRWIPMMPTSRSMNPEKLK